MLSGMLASRLASHALAACSSAVPYSRTAWLQWRGAASAASQPAQDSAAKAAPAKTLSAAERKELSDLLSAMDAATDAALRLGTLTHLSVTYRDLSVAMTALAMREKGLHPLADDPAALATHEAQETDLARQIQGLSKFLGESPAGAAAAAAGDDDAETDVDGVPLPPRGMYLPVRDVTLQPDDVQVDGETPAPAEPEYDQEHMDKISCWAALQPNHIETSQALMTGVMLFPPTEATYPTFVDFDAALRRLRLHTSRKRLRLAQRLRRKQDKYQLKTWEHSPGEA